MKPKSLKGKWQVGFRLYLCKCGMAFWSRKHFYEHIRDTGRWRKYHYAPDYKEVPFIIHVVHKRNKNINEAFVDVVLREL